LKKTDLEISCPAPGSCSLEGTWYGGSQTAKYLLTIVPTTGGDYTMIWDGAYPPQALGPGIVVKTMITGSIIKIRRRGYEAFAIGMAATADANALPSIGSVHAVVSFTGCDTMSLKFDFFGMYMWGKTPFIDFPDVTMPAGFTETYKRMPTTCKVCGS
jgi:hypothetical protein